MKAGRYIFGISKGNGNIILLLECVVVFVLVLQCRSISIYGVAERPRGKLTTCAMAWKNDGGLSGSPSTSTAYVLSSASAFVTSVSMLKLDPHHTRITQIRSMLYMGKGDGKKKRKKKATNTAPTTPSQPKKQPQPQPQRVSTDINVPIRMQIEYGRRRKEAARHAGTSFRQKKVVRTAFRKTWNDEEMELKREERKRKGQDPDWDVILSRNATRPLVIVDGYNIIHKWPRLKKHMRKGNLQRARQLLLDDLEDLQSINKWRIEVVFDGMGRARGGPLASTGTGINNSNRPSPQDREANIDVSKHGVRVVFTGVGVEADSYIESRCASAKKVTDGEMTGSLIVATDDSMIRLAGAGAGALCMSADRLVNELKAVKRATRYRVEVAVAKANGHAVRPEKLRGTEYNIQFGKNQFVIEDKRNRTKAQKLKKQELEREALAMDLNLDEDDDDDDPWWAVLPNNAKPYT